MKKLFALLASAVLAAAAIPRISPARQNVAAADKIKIMPAGDSITFGMGDDGGYRKYLDVQLKQKSPTTITMQATADTRSSIIRADTATASWRHCKRKTH